MCGSPEAGLLNAVLRLYPSCTVSDIVATGQQVPSDTMQPSVRIEPGISVANLVCHYELIGAKRADADHSSQLCVDERSDRYKACRRSPTANRRGHCDHRTEETIVRGLSLSAREEPR